jgi:preprotein translocase subunit SecY
MGFFEQISNMVRIRDLRRRLLVTLAILAVTRIGVYIPVPGLNTDKLRELLVGSGGPAATLMNMINMFTGGALSNGAIFALNVMPYISASIIFQLLMNVVPHLEQLRKEGEAGRRKLNQYTRVATVFICMFQGAIMVRGLQSFPGVVPEDMVNTWIKSLWFNVSNGFLLMTGTMFLMWLGEQIDEHGIGNGISLIIMCNILDRLPSGITLLAKNMAGGAESQQNAVLKGATMIALFLAVVVAIVLITKGERRIPVQQAKHVRGPKVYGGQKSYLPLKVNQAGVMPLIFASALLQFPAIIAGFAVQGIQQSRDSFWYKFFTVVRDAVSPGGTELGLTYVLLDGLLIFFFCYFWTAIMFNPKEMSENLKDYGSFIPGIRPGKHTADYLEGIMNRVTLAGSAFLVILALLPQIVAKFMNVNFAIAGLYGGTSILIVVGVALDMATRINEHLEMRRYSGFAAGAAARRRSRRR